MSPRLEPTRPPYVQITDLFRQKIHDGTLPEGTRLPTIADVAQDYGVARATAAKAIAQLQVEGLIITSPRGSFVAAREAKAVTPQTRIIRARRTGSTAGQGEHHHVNVAEIIPAPTYVAELFDFEPGAEVVRREFVTIDGGLARVLTVTWHPAALAASVPELLSTEQSNVGPMLTRIEAVTGPAAHGRDYFHARTADAREASALGLPIGTAILAGTWLTWANADERLIEYGEFCLPPRHTLSYPYEVSEESPDD